MSCIPLEAETRLARPAVDQARLIRDVVFWGFILLVIVSPALLSAWVLAQG
jgi:hypothetical protein